MPFPLFVLVTFLIAAGTLAAAALLSHRRNLAISVGALGAIALLLIIGPGYFDCFADDAYITFRYAKHLAEGLGPDWNSTGQVEGYTSFSWMAILAGTTKLGADTVLTSEILGFLAILATFGAVYGIWRLWAADDAGSGLDTPVVPVAAFVGLALTDGTTFWGFSGLETPLFIAAITGGAYLFLRELRSASLVPWSALVLAAACLTRPEGVIAAAVTGGFVLARIATEQDRQRAIVRAAVWGGAFLGLFGAYFLWRYSYYDYLFPNTYYAKAGNDLAVMERGLDYVWRFGLRYQVIALLGGAALLLTRPRLQTDAAYIFSLSGAMILGVIIEGGDAFGHGRFLMPLLPLLYLGGISGLALLLRQLSIDSTRGVAISCAVLGFAGLSLYPGLEEQLPCRTADELHQRQVLGEWFSENAPEDYTIAAFAVGALAYHTDQDVLDLLGINDTVIAHTNVPDFGRGLAGHEKYNVDYVFDDVRPEIIVPSDAEPGSRTTEELREFFSTPSPLRARNAYLSDPRLWRDYEVRTVNVDGYWFNFLQRKDTVQELQSADLQ
jgi:hypothetical protein